MKYLNFYYPEVIFVYFAGMRFEYFPKLIYKYEYFSFQIMISFVCLIKGNTSIYVHVCNLHYILINASYCSCFSIDNLQLLADLYMKNPCNVNSRKTKCFQAFQSWDSKYEFLSSQQKTDLENVLITLPAVSKRQCGQHF